MACAAGTRCASDLRRPLYEGGPGVKWWLFDGSSVGVVVSSWAHLSMAPSVAVMSWVGAAPVAQFSSGPSCGQGRRGASRSKGLTGGQHVPDRFAQPAGDVDGGDLGSSFLAVSGSLAGE